jgi:hypothetical protein
MDEYNQEVRARRHAHAHEELGADALPFTSLFARLDEVSDVRPPATVANAARLRALAGYGYRYPRAVRLLERVDFVRRIGLPLYRSLPWLTACSIGLALPVGLLLVH